GRGLRTGDGGREGHRVTVGRRTLRGGHCRGAGGRVHLLGEAAAAGLEVVVAAVVRGDRVARHRQGTGAEAGRATRERDRRAGVRPVPLALLRPAGRGLRTGDGGREGHRVTVGRRTL